jgi:hypothetical protein
VTKKFNKLESPDFGDIWAGVVVASTYSALGVGAVWEASQKSTTFDKVLKNTATVGGFAFCVGVTSPVTVPLVILAGSAYGAGCGYWYIESAIKKATTKKEVEYDHAIRWARHRQRTQ